MDFHATYRIFRFVARMTGVACFRLRAEGQANVPQEGGVILAANHASFLDPLIIGSALSRPMHSLARETLFAVPGLGALLPRILTHPLRRDAGDVVAFRQAVALLRGGACLLIFPEGTRSRDGRAGAIRPGVGLLAKRSAVCVVPARIRGSFRAWPRHRAWPRASPVCVRFFPAIAPAEGSERIVAAIRSAWETE